MVVLRLTAQVLEDALLPELFHVGPVLNLTVLDGIFSGIGFGVGHGLVTDEEVQILDGVLSSLGSRVTGGRTEVLASSSLDIFLDTDHTGNDVVWLAVSSETHLGVTTLKEDRQAVRNKDTKKVTSERKVSRLPCSIVNNRGRESVSAHVPGVRRE